MGERKVKIDSNSLVVPSGARVLAGYYPLSNLDHMMGLHNVRLVYYYKNVSKQANLKLISAFKMSLKTVLKSYPAACGRLHKRGDGNWEIECNDAGVKVFEANVDSTLENWFQIADRSAELKLCHWEDLDTDFYRSSLVFVQFNAFKDGLAIGISCGHMLADPSCLTLIMKAWGETHRSAQVLHPSFFHPTGLKARANKNNETTATCYYESTFKREIGSSPKFKTLTFKFSHDMVHQCMLQIESGNHRYQGVTAFEALSALFWAACTRAKNQQEARLSICTEFRGKLLNPLKPEFFGNALHFSEVCMSTKDLTDLSCLAKAIHNDIRRLETEEELRSVIEWLENHKNRQGQLPLPSYLYGPHLTAINGENFFTYDCVFEQDEKPRHVSYYVEPVHGEGLIFVLPSAEGNLSRTVMLTLPEHQASYIRKDTAIKQFHPTLWMK